MSLPAALTYLYTSSDEVIDMLSSDAVIMRLDDDESGTDDSNEDLRLSRSAVNIATAKCNLYLGERYEPSQLVNSWQAHQWATVIAAVWLCRRRGNPASESLMDQLADAIDEMTMVKNRELSLADIPERESDQPTMSNMTLDMRYRSRQVRMQRPLSIRRKVSPESPIHMPTEIIAPLELP